MMAAPPISVSAHRVLYRLVHTKLIEGRIGGCWWWWFVVGTYQFSVECAA